MTDKEKLDDAIKRLKQQLAKSKEEQWKQAYLKGIARHNQSLNITRGVQ